MTTLLLIRHGETDAIDKVLAGWMSGWPLNARGREQVERLAETLRNRPLEAVYSSPLERTIDTARAIARHHQIEPQPLDEIGEMHVGEWQGKTFEELAQCAEWKAFNTRRSGIRPPGGEWMIDCQARMVKAAERVARRHPNGAVALVSHGDPLRALLAYFLGIPIDLLPRFELGIASVSVVEVGDFDPRVLCLNHTQGIPA